MAEPTRPPAGGIVLEDGHPDGLTAPEEHPPAPPRSTRKRMALWDRLKFFVLLGLLFFVLVWAKVADNSPIMPFSDAVSIVAEERRWIFVLLGVELLRQVHYVISERSAAYHHFWTERVFGRADALYRRKLGDWTRFRIGRMVKWLVWIAIIAVVLGAFYDEPPVLALFHAPTALVSALPMILQLMLFMFIAVGQFVAIFWFLSRGGVDTYFPDDIKTRFSDVWGQDHVLNRVKENILYLEHPERIEEKGGYVPGGILLWGPPGTGKTLMAEAVAGETGKPYVFVDPGAFTNMFIGVGILKVKSLFRKLRKLALRYGGVIVFFDEADALGNRGALTGGQPGGGQGGAAPAPFAATGCNGFSHLTPQTQWLLAREAMRQDIGESESSRRNGFVMGAGMGGGGGMGTLQALLTELSGLKKPRGFVNRVVRRTLGMRPKPPPKYRILVMMATNMPEALDEALLRPGRIDRIYKVGYPSKAGRVRTYEGYLDKVRHELDAEQIEKLAVITPYATGATIKDMVNEALITAIRDGREVIEWRDVMKAKQLKELGPPEDVEYIERERHAVAVHEACHAVMAYRTRRHMEIDIATIEKGSTYLGMVASIPPEDQFTRWRTEYESDVLVSLASLAGERMFFGGDNSSGVSGDLESATSVATMMEGYWGMGGTVSSYAASRRFEVGSPGGGGKPGVGKDADPAKEIRRALADRIEDKLGTLLEEAERILKEHRSEILALASALESLKTLSGEDVVAILEGRDSQVVDGRGYKDEQFRRELESYHEAAISAHQAHAQLAEALPLPPTPGSRYAPPSELDALYAPPREASTDDVEEREGRADQHVTVAPDGEPESPREGTP